MEPRVRQNQAAAESAAGHDAHLSVGEADRAAAGEVIAHAVKLMRDTEEESENRLLGALSIDAIARSSPDFTLLATGLLFSGSEQARALGARSAPASPELFRVVASDPSPRVRAALASRTTELPDDIAVSLANDPHAHVRHASRSQANEAPR